MKLLKILFIIGIFCFVSKNVISQNVFQIKQNISKVFKEARKGNDIDFPVKLITDKSENIILSELSSYYSDSVDLVRLKAFEITRNIGIQSSDSIIRIKSVNILINGCNDINTGISGRVTDYLTEFKVQDFNDEAKNKLLNIILTKPAQFKKLILLAGFIKPQNFEDKINELLLSTQNISKPERWSIHLALARTGNINEVTYVVSKIKKLTVNNDVVVDIFPDLIYIRNKLAIDYLVEILNSDEKNCSSPDPEKDEKIICGYRVLEYLIPIIKNFPLKLKPSGDIDYNYEEAIHIARKWFSENSDYEINKEIY